MATTVPAESTAPTRAFALPPTQVLVPAVLTVITFVALFAHPAKLLALDWWNNPEAGHGLLLFPVSLWFGYKAGIRKDAAPNMWLGIAIVLAAVLFRYAADLASELFVMRGSMLMGLAGLVVFAYGFRQVLHWWLPFTLTALSIPIPDVLLGAMALPLQFTASKIGAALLEWRQIPVLLTGNVIRIPGQELFVAEACSGLRSLTALISLGVLMGAMLLRHPASRVLLIALTIPIAVAINGVRIFLTGFLVLFISPEFGEGFMHTSEGMIMFAIAFGIVGAVAWVLGRGEGWIYSKAERRSNNPKPPVPPSPVAVSPQVSGVSHA